MTVDENYRGPFREDGMRWNGDLERYDEPTDVSSYRIFEEDGVLKCRVVYIGQWNVEITRGEELEVRKTIPDNQEFYRWLLENKKVKF